ncbi:MAG: hypothetical protein MJ104_04570 [Lachnospiraceae bacterium]|nr:hypothetical protein [Lachnospiraceae bacterium]
MKRSEIRMEHGEFRIFAVMYRKLIPGLPEEELFILRYDTAQAVHEDEAKRNPNGAWRKYKAHYLQASAVVNSYVL